MIALTLAVSVLFGVSPNFSADMTSLGNTTGMDGIVESFPNMNEAMGLAYDPVNDLLWQATQDGGWVYNVDPVTGAYDAMFDINLIFGSSELASNGCYYDETNNYLYLSDFNGDVGATFNDAIYCFDVDDPYFPPIVDTWDFGTTDGILGIAYKAPYWYCSFYLVSELRSFTLNPGGTFTLENTWAGVAYGGIWYDEVWNVFYTHDGLGTSVYILDGDDPANVLDTFVPGCEMDCAMSNESDPAILWTADRDPNAFNYRIDDEYVPVAFEQSTWGNIKTEF